MLKYIVKSNPYLLVRSQMETRSSSNIIRRMSNGEGFTVYQTYVVRGNQLWGRLSDNPGGVEQEYACLQIANKVFAVAEESQPNIRSSPNPMWFIQIDAWARTMGYTGIPPFI